MNYRFFWNQIIILIVSISAFVQLSIMAKAQEKEPAIVLYSTQNTKISANVNAIETNLSSVFNIKEVKSVHAFDKQNIKSIKNIIYIGEWEEKLPTVLTDTANNKQQRLLVFGKNIQQFKTFSRWKIKKTINIRRINQTSLKRPHPVEIIQNTGKNEILMKGYDLNNSYPLVIKNDNNYYFTSTELQNMDIYSFSKLLADEFQKENAKHPVYILLDDVTPFTNAKKLHALTKILEQQGKPYYIAVTPVVSGGDNKSLRKIQDNQALLKVLKEAQSSCAMIIAKGYLGSYDLNSNTVKMEFWDIKRNQAVTAKNANDAIVLKSETDFANEKQYSNYLKRYKKEEEHYTENRLSSSINELGLNHLYPLGLEIPNYGASNVTYQIASQHFSTMFGKVQYSNSSNDIGSPLFVSKPDFLNSMILYPVTVQMMFEGDRYPFEKVMDQLDQIANVSGSAIGVSFSTSIDARYLSKVLNQIELLSNIYWLNLKEKNNIVKTSEIQITQKANQKLDVTFNYSLIDRLKQSIKDQPLEMILWILAIVVLLFIIIFFVNVLRLRMVLKKRLFEERRSNG
ncbi:DUF2334 domain-containing protein [Rummeliibacillus suwonensis]|uniref:DUF2334 domain-containing protein n=1 Tax=Rummeliibacillus suwonensis TaxID=1306154 RepID=UPI0011B775FE|nr:DUF2334 domain-containing protein [Rummeliibacillus suwonensis]